MDGKNIKDLPVYPYSGAYAQEAGKQQDRTRFLELIRSYADIRELDAATLNHLVRKIVIQEDIDGDAIRQTVEIHFNFNNQADKVSLIRK